jgi:hypothetical protein
MAPSPTPDDEVLDRLLRAERFYAFPPDLAANILAERLAPVWSVRARVLGLVGAVLLAVGAVAARTGALPAAPSGLPSDWMAPPVVVPAQDLAAAAPDWAGALGAPGVALAALLLAGGIALARRSARTVAQDAGGPR